MGVWSAVAIALTATGLGGWLWRRLRSHLGNAPLDGRSVVWRLYVDESTIAAKSRHTDASIHGTLGTLGAISAAIAEGEAITRSRGATLNKTRQSARQQREQQPPTQGVHKLQRRRCARAATTLCDESVRHHHIFPPTRDGVRWVFGAMARK